NLCFFFQAEDGIRDFHVTGVQTCALPISEQLPELPVAARLRAAAPIFHSPNNSAGVVLDDKRLWLLGNPGMAAALKRLNNSKSRTVSDSSWDSIPRGGSLG